jgi:hypothetical protein
MAGMIESAEVTSQLHEKAGQSDQILADSDIDHFIPYAVPPGRQM